MTEGGGRRWWRTTDAKQLQLLRTYSVAFALGDGGFVNARRHCSKRLRLLLRRFSQCDALAIAALAPLRRNRRREFEVLFQRGALRLGRGALRGLLEKLPL